MTAPRLRLSGAAFALLGAWQAVGTAALLLPPLLYLYLAALPALVLVFARDRRSFAALGPTSVAVDFPRSIELDRPAVARFHLHWRAPPAGRQRVLTWQAPVSKLVAWGADSRRLVVQAGCRDASFDAALTATRLGREALSPARILQSSAAGLWTRGEDVAIGTPDPVRVVPAQTPVPPQVFAQVARDQAPLFAGARKSQRARAADQFHSVRKYQFPDLFRHVDQKKSARYQQLMTRTYETHHQHNLVIALDLGRSMAGRLGASDKRDFYLAAAANLADNALRSRDRVSFLAFDEEIRVRVPASTTMTALAFLTNDDPRLAVRAVESNYELVSQGLRDLGAQRSIVVLLTDAARPSVQAGVMQSLGAVCLKHLTVVVSLIDQAFDVDQVALTATGAELSEAERSQLLYAYWLQDEFAVFRRRFSRVGGGVVVSPPDHWLDMVKKVYGSLRVSARA